jgi:hypothetical protein
LFSGPVHYQLGGESEGTEKNAEKTRFLWCTYVLARGWGAKVEVVVRSDAINELYVYALLVKNTLEAHRGGWYEWLSCHKLGM